MNIIIYLSALYYLDVDCFASPLFPDRKGNGETVVWEMVKNGTPPRTLLHLMRRNFRKLLNRFGI
jgi:hypothetical protein